MKDIRITKDANGIDDIKLVNGKFRWAKDGTQAANHCHMRLQIPRGTLSLNGRLSNKEHLGFQLYEIILNTAAGELEKQLEIKRVIMETPGFLKLLSFSYVQTGHSVAINGGVQSEWGEMTLGDDREEL